MQSLKDHIPNKPKRKFKVLSGGGASLLCQGQSRMRIPNQRQRWRSLNTWKFCWWMLKDDVCLFIVGVYLDNDVRYSVLMYSPWQKDYRLVWSERCMSICRRRQGMGKLNNWLVEWLESHSFNAGFRSSCTGSFPTVWNIFLTRWLSLISLNNWLNWPPTFHNSEIAFVLPQTMFNTNKYCNYESESMIISLSWRSFS